jgi:prepilin-type N-terminal cleavage/methylation domain-containing protein
MTYHFRKRGFTIVEILVVISIIALLAALMLVVVNNARGAADTAKTTVKLKQITEWMQIWSGNNDDRVLPSQFDHTDEVEAGANAIARLRDPDHIQDDNLFDDMTRGQYQGTWADLLWVDNTMHQVFGLNDMEEDEQHLLWSTNAPDNDIYDIKESFNHPFRSTFENSRGPYKGLPGFFAANDFFDSRSDEDSDGDTLSKVDRDYTYSMIHSAARSVYLVDSVVGETIGDEPGPWMYDFHTDNSGQIIGPDEETEGEVDYRYGGECMLLLLDGSTVRMTPWPERGPSTLSDPDDVDLSLYGQGYRVHELTKRKSTP